MSVELIREVVKALDDSREVLASSLQGVTEAQARMRPAEGKWSLLDCTEHLYLVEERFLQRLQSAPGTKPDTVIDREKEAGVAAGMGDRTRKSDAYGAEAHAHEQRGPHPGSQRSAPIVSELRVAESEGLRFVEPPGRTGIEAEPGEELQQQRRGAQKAENSEFTVGEAVRQQREQEDPSESRDSKSGPVHTCLAERIGNLGKQRHNP